MWVFKNSEFINSMGKASPKFLNFFQHFYAQMKYIISSFSFSMQEISQTEIFLSLYKIVLVSINGYNES